MTRTSPNDARECLCGRRELHPTSRIRRELYPDAKKIGTQLRYAERKGHRVAVLYGTDEQEQGLVKVRDLAARTETTIDLENLTKQWSGLLP